ncbi:hypothetical protein Q2T42_26460 [Leptolyngbya boryana CZ1]|uniref:Uncharacterized protein n=1 Tax=Leptolyngbya boryana CZ1 TaxID=3060204 RepID=A0AA96X4D3_LEPBY|nr:hypothetical protein [Leptolyngbya boryana]WNZ45335.1 hypothetical protein Q2T42_26460 [Leptolyngbya boryana CZ1]
MVTIPEQATLDSLEKRSGDIVQLARQHDSDSQATLSAKRRFFLVELDVAGLSPDSITPEQIAAIQAQGYPNLVILLQAFYQIREYSSSPERLQWNPDTQPGRTNVPICMDWFIASIVPEELNQFDFLSRCERIWTDSAPAGEGMLFTRIFNYQVKFVTGYEDGLRLVLCRVEVGARSHPPQASRRPTFAVKPFDLTRRMDAYDGSPDGEDWNCPVKVPMGISRWDFTLAEIDRQDFKQLRDQLGDANFQTIVETQGYVHPQNELSTYRGEDDLSLRYYIRETDQAKVKDLILVSFGEFQPCRWVAHIEGIWQIIEEDEPTPESKPVEAASIPELAQLG